MSKRGETPEITSDTKLAYVQCRPEYWGAASFIDHSFHALYLGKIVKYLIRMLAHANGALAYERKRTSYPLWLPLAITSGNHLLTDKWSPW